MLPALVLALRAAQAATLHVGGPAATHDSIEEAVRDAAAGDTIEVAAGAWSERTITVDQDLTLTGVGGSAAVSWSAQSNDVVLRITNGATVAVTGFSIVARGRAVAVRVDDATATFTDLRVHGNEVNDGTDGSALVAVQSTVTLADADFADNRAPGGRGAHVYAVRSDLTVTGGAFRTGGADRGGAFFLDQTDLRCSGGTSFAENAAVSGGAIAAINGTLELESATFDANRAVGEEGFPFPQPAGDGGAFHLDDTASLTLRDSLVQDGVAEITGGAISVNGDASVVLDTTRLVGNRADYGGALYVSDRATVEIDGSYLAENAAENGNGGAIRVRTAGAAGGLSIAGSRFVANTASQTGGAIATTSENGDSAPVTVTLSEFTDNTASAQGGALSLDDPARLLVDNTLLCHNRATGDGGGAWVTGAGADHRWTNVVFAENRADDDGGGLFVQPGADDAEIFDAGFFANGAGRGGGVYLEGAPAVITNTIVAWTVAGDGIAGTAPSLVVDYDDFFQNTAQDLPAGVSGTGNLAVDPGLAAWSRDGDCSNDDFWIVATSPLVDAGNPAVDDVDGSRSDIGPYGGPEARWPELVDEDGDGALATVDCDDANAGRFPGNPELCDGRDQDCDGVADEEPTDASTWWVDADADGYGVDGTEVVACEPPEGTAEAGGDCDDGAEAVHPGALEVCDDLDTDCDGNGDTGNETETWPDVDGDGFGDADADALTACGPVAGRVDNADDCDDGSAAVYPGAEDAPGDGVDADCDGADGDPPETVDPGTTDPTGDGGGKDTRITAGGGCGCDAGPGGSGAGLAGVLALAAAARRRRGATARR